MLFRSEEGVAAGSPETARGKRRCTYRLELSVVLLRQLVDEGRDHAAGPAPGRPEVHENGNVALEHLSLEGGIGHDGGGACFGSRGERGGQTTDGTEREKMLTRRRSCGNCSIRSRRDASELRTGHPTRDAAMAAKPGRDSKRTVAVGDLGLAHEARAGGRAGGRARAELHAGFAREGNLRAQGSHVGGDGGHGLGVWANVSSSDRRLARCVRATNLRARQGRRRLWRAHPGRASTRLAKESGVSGRILQLYKAVYSTVFQSQSFTEAEKLPIEKPAAARA